MASDRVYRQRLEADLARWEAEGLLSRSAAAAIRTTLQPLPEGITIATVVATCSGLLIAAAFLAFIAANWALTARPARFGILLAGIIGAHAVSGWFDRNGRPLLSDLAAAVGAVVFGAAIALSGQMYHLGDDFAAGLLLWAAGALIAAALTDSRGALAVALVAGCLWSGARVFEISDAHLPFVGFWLVSALLACAWDSTVARHLVAVAALVWLALTGVGLEAKSAAPAFAVCAGSALLVGGGLALGSLRLLSIANFGLTLSNYGAIALAAVVALTTAGASEISRGGIPLWTVGCGGAGLVLAVLASLLNRRLGPVLAAVSLGLALLVASNLIQPPSQDEPWLAFALALASMLFMVASGMLDDARPRVVAGWIGLGAAIAAITWALKGSLIRRAAFLAAAGVVTSGLARLLGTSFGGAGFRPAPPSDVAQAPVQRGYAATRRTALIGGIPSALLFAAATVVQTGLLVTLVIERARILRDGTEVTLATRPLDPRDFLRGDYVVLNYDISTVPAGSLKDAPAPGQDVPIYVKLAPRNGLYAAVSLHRDFVPVSGGEVLIRGRVANGANCGADSHSFCNSLTLKYGIERYFVPEGEGRSIERASREGQVTVVAAVTKAGHAAIKRLLIDGRPVYDEPLY